MNSLKSRVSKPAPTRSLASLAAYLAKTVEISVAYFCSMARAERNRMRVLNSSTSTECARAHTISSMNLLAVRPRVSMCTPHCFASRRMPHINSGMMSVRSLFDIS